MNALARVIDADPAALRGLVQTLAPSIELSYAKVRLFYMEHQTDALARLLSEIKEPECLARLARMRLSIRQGTVRAEEIAPLIESAAAEGGAWLAEAHNVAAMAFEMIDAHAQAKAHYLKAYGLCLERDCPKRAATTYHNAIAAESRVHPEKRLIYEYHHAYRVALDAQDFGTAGTALSNLAREYQLMHGFGLAMKYINQAVELLEKTHYGTYQHINALCNRCHLLLDTGQWRAAKTDYQQIACFSMEEAKAAMRTLEALFVAAGETVPDAAPAAAETFTWRERRLKLKEELGRPKELTLTTLEEHLLVRLSERPQTKHDLADYLYGRVGDPTEKENRLKQLLFRLRRKLPGLVLFEDGVYRIAEPHAECNRP